MKEFAFFPGCTIPSGFPEYERLVLRMLNEFDISVRYIDGLTCCPAPMSFDMIDETAYLTIGARNLSLVEDEGLDIISPCNGCTMTLSRVNRALKENVDLKERVNSHLGEINRKYNGKVRVSSLLRILYEDVGCHSIAKKVKNPLDGLKVAIHYGCHAFEELDEYNNQMNPTALEELCEALGAEVVPYDLPNECCLIFANPVDRDYVFKEIQRKMRSMTEAGADCLVVICASCFSQYDRSQEIMGWIDLLDEDNLLPVFLYPELLAAAMGWPIGDIGLDEHKVTPYSVLERFIPNITE